MTGPEFDLLWLGIATGFALAATVLAFVARLDARCTAPTCARCAAALRRAGL